MGGVYLPPVQLGFVIDHSRCIGCHACTVACKSENEVPLGSFRTWVKYTETGEFPAVKRHFAVLRCNQCTAAPCVTICPTSALEKRADGIVDVTRDHCIGCKSCMQGCPYDALYINPGSGTAEKCHFCAHRTEMGLAPACAIVCPTEAIIPGDFDDPESVVSRLRADGGLEARKLEAGTGPNVLYKEAEPAGLKPLETSAAGGYLWSNRLPGPELDAEVFRSMEERARARTTYDVEHQNWWGWRVSAYLVTKAVSAGVVLAAVPTMLRSASDEAGVYVGAIGILFLLITTALLVFDLKRPERFWLILRRPNWDSWLVKGTVFLMAHGFLLALWAGLAAADSVPDGALRWLLVAVMAVVAAGSAAYTGFLFAQAKGRVLWMQRGLWLHLIARAAVAGAAFLLLLRPFVAAIGEMTGLQLIGWNALLVHLLFTACGGLLAPRNREEEYHLAHKLLARGPFARHHRQGLLLSGTAMVLIVAPVANVGPWPAALGGALVLLALWRGEDGFVRAGQAVPIS